MNAATIILQFLKTNNFIGLKNKQLKCYCHVDAFFPKDCDFDCWDCEVRKDLNDKPVGSAYGPKE
jgi:hypothetical protein